MKNNVAIVMTVKNEERLLRKNILYHQSIGVDHFYIYFDGTTDQGRESIEDLPFVTTLQNVEKGRHQNNQLLEIFTSNYDSAHTARQCLNTYDAQQRCLTSNQDWLISIDPDELIVPKGLSTVPELFVTISPDVDLVHFNTYECLQRKVSYQDVFGEEVFFKTPRQRSRHPYFFPNILQEYPDIQNSYIYGHILGKGALRVSSQNIPETVHTYKDPLGNPVQQTTVDSLLHYHAYDAADFIKKFTNFKNRRRTYLNGDRMDLQKEFFIELVNTPHLSQQDIQDFFRKNILFPPLSWIRLRIHSMIRRLFGHKPPLIKESFVSNTIKKIDQNLYK